LVFTVALGKKGEQVKECRIKSGEGIAGWVAEKEEPLLIPDANEDKRFCHDVDDKTGFVTKSLIAVPLSIKAKTIGVIEVINKTNDGTFNETDMNTLITVANQIAIAIDNATMTADLKRSNVRIEGYSKNLEMMVRERTMELETANMELKEVHAQVVQTEKLSSIGYLAAGIAHEINNPIGFVSSNIRTLGEYVEDILCLLKGYEAVTHEARINGYPLALNKIEKIKESMQFDFVREDIGKLIAESKDGADRVHQIVQDLKNFARADNAKRSFVDIHSSLDSTLNIVWNELKYKAEIVKDYGDLPMVKCLPMKLNQVFMNILINAAQSIKENGAITIRTYAERKMVIIKISDTGEGIEEKTMNKIFDPFFTTKEPGKGTGLGLSVSYNIIKEHNGEIDVKSTIGKGTTFTISIPVSVGASETPQAQDKDEALAV
ncbi:MAG: GAF domain-containing protein, partial [Candidatus Omnitrophica bacterium]|nr:GAF domain-containing protein [Candidatus Omnitrophota bacterium]